MKGWSFKINNQYVPDRRDTQIVHLSVSPVINIVVFYHKTWLWEIKIELHVEGKSSDFVYSVLRRGWIKNFLSTIGKNVT